MPEVGVLNLTIQDNSTEAAGGLSELTGALVSLQNALGQGLKLSGVSKPLNTFANAVKENSKTFANVGTFLNAMSTYKKAFDEADKVRFNAQPIRDLKDAIGDGIRLGQAGTQIKNIREALTGEWNTDNAYKAGQALAAIGEGAKSIPSGLEKKADGISKVAAALQEYADASERIKSVVGGSSIGALNESAGRMSIGGRSFGLQFFGGKKEEVSAPFEQVKMNLDDLFEKYEETTHQMTDSYKDFVQETKQIQLDFSKFDVANLPMGALGMTIEQLQNGGKEAYNFRNAIKDTETELLKMKPNADLERFNDNAPKSIIVYGSDLKNNVQNTWEAISERIASARAEEQKFYEAEKQWGWGTGSIEKLVNDQGWLGNSLRGLNGRDMQANAIDQVSRNTGLSIENIHQQLYDLSDGFIKLGKTADDVVNGGSMSKFREELDNILNSSIDGESKIGLLMTKIALTENAIEKRSDKLYERGLDPDYDKTIVNYKLQIMSLYDQVDKLIDKQRELRESTKFDAMKEQADNLQRGYGAEMVENLVSNYNNIDLMTVKLNGMKQALADDINQNKVDTQQIAERTMAIQSLTEKIDELKAAQEAASGSTFSLGDAWKGLKAGIKGMFPTLTGMIKRLGTIAKYRFIRSVIKHITSGFSEGIQNVYEYSKAVGGSFAPAMDSAATAIAQMKNSLGAALAPAIQALIPILNTVVNWFISAVNVANQFFALLNGQATWTRALPATVNAFDKQKKAAKGAGNAIKDLLADWDELNIIQSESGGGGAGSSTAAEDYLKMFEEVGKFDNEIKDTVKFIQDNMNDVTDIIKDAGIALLGWKFSKAFTGPLSAVGALIAAGKIMEITWKLTGLFDNEFVKTGNDGWIIADAMTNMFGAFLAGTALETVLGGGTGVIMAGVTLVVSGGISYGIALTNAQSDKADVLRDLAFIKTGIGLAAMSVGFGLATGSAVAGISLAAAFGVPMFVLSAAVTTVVQQIKTAKQIAKDAFTGKHYGAISVQELYDELNDEFKRQSQGYNIVIDAFAEVPDLRIKLSDAADSIAMFTSVINGDGKLTQEEANEFKQAWTTVFSAMTDISSATFTTVFDALNISLTSENEEIRKQAKELRISLLMVKKNISEGMAEAEAEMQDLAGKIANSNATQEELERYQKYIEALAKYTNTSFDDFNETIQKGAHIDFENMDEVNEYIQNVKSSYQGIADEIDTGVNTAVDALNEAKREAQFLYDSGQISDEEYKGAIAYFKQTEDNIRKAAEERKSSMQTSLQDAYSLLLSSALQNLHDIPLDKNGNHDYISAIAYIYDYIEPIVKAIVDAGGEVDEELARALQLGVDPGEEVNKIAQGLLEDNQLNLTIADYIRKFYGDAEPEPGPSTDPLDQFIQKISDFERQYGEALKGLDNTTAEYAKRVRENLAIAGEYTFGDDYSPIIENTPELNTPVIVEVTDIGVDVDADEIDDLYNEIAEQIEKALQDGNIDVSERNFLDNMFGADFVEEALERYENYKNGFGWSVGKMPNGSMSASVPAVPVATSPFLNGSETVKTEPADSTQDAANVETGVRAGNKPLESLLDQLIVATNRNADRPINISLFPSSGWGFMNNASGVAVDKVNG